jgi:deazaflavin-dependent oxidoreductase (nitroreductase family)
MMRVFRRRAHDARRLSSHVTHHVDEWLGFLTDNRSRPLTEADLYTANERSPVAETPAEYNAKIIGEFRANSGRVGGMWEGTPLLLLHHTGAKSGASHVNPVAYLPDDARYLIWAANGGAPKHPAWYQNLTMQPNTSIEVGSETIDIVAEEATGDQRESLFARATERYPSLAEIARKTTRVIPLMVLTPRQSP